MVRALDTCPGFDAHLVLLTRKVSGTTGSPVRFTTKRRRCAEGVDDSHKGPHKMAEVRAHLTLLNTQENILGSSPCQGTANTAYTLCVCHFT
jgi:hypothetical protein